jgi:hypothetical protein
MRSCAHAFRTSPTMASSSSPFTTVLLDDVELAAALRPVGLTPTRTLDDRGLWIEARLYSGT